MLTLLDLFCFLLLLAKGGRGGGGIIYFSANKFTMKNERDEHHMQRCNCWILNKQNIICNTQSICKIPNSINKHHVLLLLENKL
jgi:hypothetical protein